MTDPVLECQAERSGPRIGEPRAAVLAGLFCYFTWGLVPLLMKALAGAGAGAWETTAHRCFWSVFLAAGLVWLSRQGGELGRVLRDARTLGWLFLSALLIGINWTLFTWASQNHHNLDASLGYYLNPLINMAAGALLFRERISRAGWVAVALAAAGVVLQGVALGRLPLVSLTLALSFGAYGIIRKRVRADAQSGLLVECLVLAGPALVYILWLQGRGGGHFGDPLTAALLLLAALLTVIPLASFSWAARRMPLSTLGFLQFIAPTMQFAIGAAFGETLTPLRLMSFGVIWAGVAVFVWSLWARSQAEREAHRGLVSGETASTSPAR
ncbi:MAG TPA: EamA family transporter RarD [Caulobacteraceae bacterium]|jgi:chloramphenicol-sensitive protein RarD